MKEKKIKSIQSIYIPEDKQHILEALDTIRWREHKSMSDMILEAMKEYAENHEDGNTQFKINDPVYAAPMLWRNLSVWKIHFQNLLDNEEERYKFKLQELNGLFKKRYGYLP